MPGLPYSIMKCGLDRLTQICAASPSKCRKRTENRYWYQSFLPLRLECVKAEMSFRSVNVDHHPPPPPPPPRIPRSYPSLKNTPFSRFLGEKNTPLSTEIADFEVQ